ncbi:MAG: FMN-binding negative transcriptional regulator [Rhodospirillales bacterium]|nr:MAG: FMN-binding negative transcriptional regulator [Rhodospirillales bacterium]
MYVPAMFSLTDAEAIRALMRARPFATVISTGADGAAMISHVPLIHEEDGSADGILIGHLARANPHQRLFDGKPVVAVFHGANAYISPTWYESADMVPTWNYQAVHAHGVPVPVADDHAALEIVAKLSAYFEAGLPKPWTIDKMAPGKALAMMKGITAFTMKVTRFEGKSKLGQNRTPADQRGAGEALLARPGADDRAIGALMRDAAAARS